MDIRRRSNIESWKGAQITVYALAGQIVWISDYSACMGCVDIKEGQEVCLWQHMCVREHIGVGANILRSLAEISRC